MIKSEIQPNHENRPAPSPSVWLGGKLVAAAEARISPFDHGLLTGDGVFETLKAYKGKPFELGRHHARMLNSAKPLRLTVPPIETVAEVIDAVIAANGYTGAECRIRLTVTGGIAALGSDKGHDGDTFLVAVGDIPVKADSVRVITVPYSRNEKGVMAGIKTTSYGENVVALAEAHAAGAGEAIFPNTQGNLCEGTGSNIFVVYDGELITPPLVAGPLAGVTRAVTLDLCREAGIPVREVDTPIEQLLKAEEAFLTGTLKEIMPISAIDGVEIPCPGPLSTRIREAFREFTATFAG